MEAVGIHLTQTGTVTITTRLGELECREGSLLLHSPTIRWPDGRITDQTLIENYGAKEEQSVTIGPYVAGTKLILEIRPKTSLCEGHNFLSTNLLHARTTHHGSDRWTVAWEDYTDTDFDDLYVDIKVNPTEASGGIITIEDNVIAREVDIQYRLPWRAGESHPVTQVPNQGYHQGANAYDFGGEFVVVAPEDGTILWVEDNFGSGRCRGNLRNKANVIVLKTTQATQVTLVHLKRNSAEVSIGDRVVQGQELAVSNSSGFVCGPHLHFEFQHNCHSLSRNRQIYEDIKQRKRARETFAWSCPTKADYSEGFWVNGEYLEELEKGRWYDLTMY
jgi:murein DD-endopeptidase MepM/ murein hydrolase activator NlpD